MNFANILTLSRVIILIPYVLLLYIDNPVTSWIALAIFISACLTDYFDGLVARIWNQSSTFGRFLDPVADKLLIGSSLIMLTGIGRISGFSILAAVVILCREILVSGLREFLSTVRVSLPVSRLAKWKTGIQMGALACLIVNVESFWWINGVGIILLWAATILTFITGYDYLRAAGAHFQVNKK